jgi:hypothetical protein
MNKSIIVAVAIAAIAIGMVASTTVLTTSIAFANPKSDPHKWKDLNDKNHGGGNDKGAVPCPIEGCP